VLPMEKPEPEVAADLVRRIASGDRAAEEELARRYSQGLLFHLRRTTGDPSLSDDLHQETFRVVLERLRGGRIADPGRLAGFILGTGRNLFLGGWRKQSRRGERDAVDVDELELLDPAPDPLDQTLREEEIREVRRLLGELGTDRDRQVLFRFYVAEEKKDRICADLGLSSLHFNRVLFRARQRFKEMLAELGEPVR
jgi:RNA polymerase sigma-70 factor (ECF subfamily)